MSAARDKDGFLVHLDDWNESVAASLALDAGVVLTAAHWRIIMVLREFYGATGVSPSMRPLVKLIRQQLGADCGNSLYLHRLFPNNPAKLAAKIAGLPRPTNCL